MLVPVSYLGEPAHVAKRPAQFRRFIPPRLFWHLGPFQLSAVCHFLQSGVPVLLHLMGCLSSRIDILPKRLDKLVMLCRSLPGRHRSRGGKLCLQSVNVVQLCAERYSARERQLCFYAQLGRSSFVLRPLEPLYGVVVPLPPVFAALPDLYDAVKARIHRRVFFR